MQQKQIGCFAKTPFWIFESKEMLLLFRDLFLIGSAVAIVIIATCRFANMRNPGTSRIENQPSVFRWLAPTMALSLIFAAFGGFGIIYLRVTEGVFL